MAALSTERIRARGRTSSSSETTGATAISCMFRSPICNHNATPLAISCIFRSPICNHNATPLAISCIFRSPICNHNATPLRSRHTTPMACRWYVRGISKVKKVWEVACRTDDLLVSFDGAALAKPWGIEPSWRTRAMGFHTDRRNHEGARPLWAP
eukprot:SAG31_NODE_2206_length_6194_cov_3.730763_2_plen_155_part_00